MDADARQATKARSVPQVSDGDATALLSHTHGTVQDDIIISTSISISSSSNSSSSRSADVATTAAIQTNDARIDGAAAQADTANEREAMRHGCAPQAQAQAQHDGMDSIAGRLRDPPFTRFGESHTLSMVLADEHEHEHAGDGSSGQEHPVRRAARNLRTRHAEWDNDSQHGATGDGDDAYHVAVCRQVHEATAPRWVAVRRRLVWASMDGHTYKISRFSYRYMVQKDELALALMEHVDEVLDMLGRIARREHVPRSPLFCARPLAH